MPDTRRSGTSGATSARTSAGTSTIAPTMNTRSIACEKPTRNGWASTELIEFRNAVSFSDPLALVSVAS